MEVGGDAWKEQMEAYEAAAAALGANLESCVESWRLFTDVFYEPWPLCIDGREYHRRQRRRAKRKGKR